MQSCRQTSANLWMCSKREWTMKCQLIAARKNLRLPCFFLKVWEKTLRGQTVSRECESGFFVWTEEVSIFSPAPMHAITQGSQIKWRINKSQVNPKSNFSFWGLAYLIHFITKEEGVSTPWYFIWNVLWQRVPLFVTSILKVAKYFWYRVSNPIL